METAGLIAVFYVQPSGKGGLGNIFSFISFKLNLVAVGRPRLGEGSVATTEVFKASTPVQSIHGCRTFEVFAQFLSLPSTSQ